MHLAEADKFSMAWLRAQRLTGHIERAIILALARYTDSVDLDGLPDLTASEANILQDVRTILSISNREITNLEDVLG